MAMAVQKLFPDAQVTIGPWIEKGFFYDFDMKEPFTEKDLKKIKKEMVGLLFCTFIEMLRKKLRSSIRLYGCEP